MGGKNMAYVTGPLQIAAGAASEYFAPGNPFGIPLITGGIGQVSGKAAGGTGSMGEMLGLAGGGLGEAGFGLAGMGPLSNMLGTTGAGQGLQGMLGMAPNSNQQLLNIAGGSLDKFAAGPGGADPLIAQGAGDLATYEGIAGAPGYASVPGATLPTSAAQAGGSGGFTGMLDTASKVAPVASALDKGTQQQNATPPAFKTSTVQSPVAPKGQAPATAVTPIVTNVPAPAGGGGRTTQENYRRMLEELSGGGTALG